MSKLSKEQIEFIEHHKISLEELFDASNMTTAEYKKYMKENGLLIAYGVTPCKKGNHELRTRYGHCVVCNPESISHIKRYNQPGYIYLAISEIHSLCKIGCSIDYNKRINSLNRQNYGCVSDWRLIGFSKQNNMGEVENLIHQKLKKYKIVKPFNKENKMVNADEIFKIEVKVLKNIIDKIGIKFNFVDIEKYYSKKINKEKIYESNEGREEFKNTNIDKIKSKNKKSKMVSNDNHREDSYNIKIKKDLEKYINLNYKLKDIISTKEKIIEENIQDILKLYKKYDEIKEKYNKAIDECKCLEESIVNYKKHIVELKDNSNKNLDLVNKSLRNNLDKASKKIEILENDIMSLNKLLIDSNAENQKLKSIILEKKSSLEFEREGVDNCFMLMQKEINSKIDILKKTKNLNKHITDLLKKKEIIIENMSTENIELEKYISDLEKELAIKEYKIKSIEDEINLEKINKNIAIANIKKDNLEYIESIKFKNKIIYIIIGFLLLTIVIYIILSKSL